MSCAELLLELKNLGARVWLEDDRLRVAAPQGSLTDEIRRELKDRRSELLDWLKRQNTLRHVRPQLGKRERAERMALSYGQQRLWFLYRMEGAGGTYNIPLGLRLEGELNVEALEEALRDVVERHEALRTVFPEEEGVAYQKVLSGEEAGLKLQVERVGDERELARRLEEAAGTGMELEKEIPLRGWLFELKEREHVLLLVLHHIAGDGWSLGPLARDVERAYRARVEGKKPEWEALRVQYGDYTVWQREVLGREDDAESVISRQLEYWRKRLEGMAEELQLPADRKRPAVMSYRGGTVEWEMDEELHEGLVGLARKSGASLFMVLQAVVAVLLSRMGGGEDIAIGTVVAGRNEEELEELVGLFVNTVVLRTDVTGDPSFSELIERVRGKALEAYGNQEVPFERLVEELEPERTQARHPLFQVMLVLQNAPEAKLELPGIRIREQRLPEVIAKFDLTFSVTEQVSGEGEARGLRGYIEYSADLFERETVEQLGARLERLLRAAVVSPQARVHELEILTAAERRQLLEEFNGRSEGQAEVTIVELFETQAAQTPEATAVVQGERSLTYQELNREANKLAHYLIAQGAGPETLVGIALERTVEMVVAIVGTLKAGAGYLPLDPEYPRARLQQMLEDASPRVVVTTESLRRHLPQDSKLQFISLDAAEIKASLESSPVHDPSDAERKMPLLPQHAAYVIYTSGSTGMPKGVVVTQQNVTRLFAATEGWFNFNATDVWTLFHSYAFDFSVWEMWGALLYGGRLVVVGKSIARMPVEFLQLLVEEGVTVLNQTPSAFDALMQAEEENEGLGRRLKLRTVVFGGEALELRRLRGWYERHGESDPVLVNMYGITETTVHVSYVALKEEMARNGMGSVIGGNIPDLRVYVLDGYLEPVAAGVVGELYVGGAGVARGYLKRAALTAERFVADPYGKERGARMYRTGDLGRWSREGVLEYRGRGDEQVKIRGFRIELGEIEAALKGEGGVGQAAVIAVEDRAGGKQLVAYVVPGRGGAIDMGELRRRVKERLPEYMALAAIVVLEELPLTGNGKLDRKALPGPEMKTEGYVAPRTGEEEVMCAVFADVLGVERVGREDNFFELGGHSLLAARLVGRVRTALGKEVGIRTLFEAPTVAELVKRLNEDRLNEERLSEGQLRAPRPVLVARTRPEKLPLSYGQQRLWFLYRMEGAGGTYNIPLGLRLEGELDVEALEEALRDVVERHEALRTVFPEEEGVAYQKVLSGEEAGLKLQVERVGDERELARRLEEAAGTGMELEKEIPLRGWLFELKEREHVLLLVLHHIAGDGWSLGPLARDVERAYRARVEGKKPEWEALRVQYGDYTVWQRELLGREDDAESVIARQLEYWRKELAGMAEELQLPTDRKRPGVMSYRGGTVGWEVDEELHGGLVGLARKSGASLFMVLQAGLGVLLSRMGGGEDIAIGTVVAGRNEEELEELVGLFVNTVVLRTDVTGDPSFSELIERVRGKALEAYGNQEVPFERLVEELEPERTQARHPLFQVMLVLQNAPEAKLELPGIRIREQRLPEVIAKFDLTFSVTEQVSGEGEARGLRGYIEYSADLFERETVEQLGARLERLLRAAVVSPQARVHELEILTAAERRQLLEEFNGRSEGQAEATIVELFETQAAQTPEATAVVQGERSLTYQELNREANKLAHYLIAQGAGPETLVGIALERTVEMVVAIVGTLKAGAGYLPLDPEYPRARLEQMLEDASPRVVVTTERLRRHLPQDSKLQFISLDAAETKEALESSPVHDPSDAERRMRLLPGHTAYVIYTSGSTGIPKGVVVTQQNVTRLFAATEGWFNFNATDVWTLFHSYAFDFSVWEMWGALLYGGRLVVVGKSMARMPVEFLQLLVEEGVTVLNQTPSAFDALMQAEEENEGLGRRLKLRTVVFGGEALELRRLRGWYERHGESDPVLVNMYGITETTVHVSYVALKEEMARNGMGSVIGGNIPDLRVYVLDGYLEPVAAGVVGELYVGGAGVARGYLKRAALTAERFVADPYGKERGARMYRTGDLGRWSREGVLEYRGRGDEQVKIRGFRIELGEIEAALKGEGGVGQAAVIAVEDRAGGKQLVAYVVPGRGGAIDMGELRRRVKERLPEYMALAAIVVLEELPLTGNGKLDRKALPGPEMKTEGYVAPRTGEEEVMCAVFADVLGVERVGREDNFFELGGHSLLAARLVGRVRTALGKEVGIRTLFEAPTVAELVKRLNEDRLNEERLSEGQLRAPRPVLVARTRPEKLPLSYGQQRLWFLYRMEGAGGTYNIPLGLRLEGELDVEALEEALRDVVERHEALRTVFPEEEGVAYQKVLSGEEAGMKLQVERVGDERELARRLEEAAGTGMELEKEIPLRGWLFELKEREHVLLLVLHHIAGDGWSLGPLARDVERAYRARVEGKKPEWEALRVQYGDYTVWQRELLGREDDAESVIARQLEYWRKELAGMAEELQLPTDRKRPGVMSYRGGTVGWEVDEELHGGLVGLARKSGASLFMVLQAGLGVLLSRMGGGEDIAIGTVVAGRNEEELEELVGLFVNTVVLRTDVTGDPSFSELIERVRGKALEAYGNQEVPFERLVEELEPERTQSRHPLFQVVLTIQNTPVASLTLPLLSTKVEEITSNVAKFDLAFGLRELVSPTGTLQGIQGEISYSKDLFDETTIKSLATRFTRLLKEMVQSPEMRLHHVEILSTEEKQLLLETFNTTSQSIPDTTVTEMFEAQAAQTPEAIAVVQGERSLTYQELNREANKLAHYLIAQGVGPETLVGIALDRSPEAVVGILAAWKSGAAYLPLDPEYPRARLEQMLEDARPRMVVTTESLRRQLPENSSTQFISLDAAEIKAALASSPTRDPSDAERTMPLLPRHAAYVIYTSGSTGVPKGVVVTHVGIPSLTRSHAQRLNLTQRSRVLQFASLNFDASFWEFLMALSSGAALVLLEDERGGIPLQGLLRKQKITHATLTPSVLSTLDEQQDSAPENLIVVGEQCPGELIARWSRRSCVINAYGPTEITVCATMSLPLSGTAIPPIGFPVINTRVYVLDGNLQPAPVGVAGELYIAGAGLARGYLNRLALTSERFIADPYAHIPGSRMYRTGDVVRWRTDGSLEFVGRADQQVKIRGFRIELGEIEAALRSLKEVADAAVVVKDEERHGKQIVAYIVARGRSSVDPLALRRKLNERLPAHMLPAAIVDLEKLPLTASGKIDRNSLSGRGIEKQRPEQPAAPQTEFESMIAGVWKEVLARDSIGMHDNFFDLGGHSLLLVQVHARLQKVLHARLPMVKLFEYPTVAALAVYLETDERHSVQANRVNRKAEDANRRHVTDIAIIGMACRFPGAPSVSRFWDNLTRGIGSITALSDEELAALPPDFVNDPSFVNATGRLENIELFDAAFFGLNPAEATATDPQQRLMLECAWEALESAGYNPRGRNIGVFAGAGESLYRDLLRGDIGLLRSLGELQLTIGTGKDHVAPRLSYLLDLRGPSVPVNTACSTSLVAVHLACQSLMHGECEMALAGGVSLASQNGYTFEENGILSPDGVCRTFDENARGTVPGSGAALVLLKPLDQAIAAGDHIHAIIKGSAINNDGNLKVGYTAPSVEGQRRVIEQALANARVVSRQISYIETHGTGTPLGDPIEVEALRQVFADHREPVSGEKLCALGSVKTNIGHCDSAAGIAGLIKAVLCLEHRTLVPSLHFEKPNRQLELDRSCFYVNTETTTWDKTPRLAGVSSFGIGGTNAHVILAEAPSCEASGQSRPWHVLTLSARSESALERQRVGLVNALLERPDLSLSDIAFTLNTGRNAFPLRLPFTGSNREDTIAALTTSREKPTRASAAERPVVFLFPGQGKAYADLGTDLYRDEPRFKHKVDDCCNRLASLIGADLRDLMFGNASGMDAGIYRPLFWQTALFGVEYAMAQLWISWGIKPAAMIGHSLGEYVAATLAGVLKLEDALFLVAERARRTEALEAGAMLAVAAREDEIYPYIKDGVSLAAVNGPELCVLAGPSDEIERLYQQIASLNPIRLDASHAFHSRLVEPLMEPLTRAASGMELRPPQIPYLSNVTGNWMTAEDATDPGYWARHVRSTVRFNDCLQEAFKKPNCILLEVGPGKVLSELASRSNPESVAFASMAGEPCGRAVAQTVGRLWSEGVAIDWPRYYETEERRRVLLPTYPFERQRYWVNINEVPSGATKTDPLALKDSSENWLYATNWKRTNPLPKAEFSKNLLTGGWLIFSEPEGIGAEIASLLRQSGQPVHEARRGKVLQQDGADSFTLNAADPENYQRLMQLLGQDFPQHIIYAWGFSNDDGISPSVGYDSLIYLAQAVASQERAASVRLALISSGLHRVLDEELTPDHEAAGLGMIHVLPKEAPAIKCQNIDIDRQSGGTRLAELVLAEFTAEIADTIVAYRRGHRWLPIVEQAPTCSNIQNQFQRGGLYVITHALQEIGFVIAEHLVREFECKVVMLDRSFVPRPHEWEQWIREQGEDDTVSRHIARLRGMQESLTVLSVDLSDRGRLKQIKTQIERDLDVVKGVLHLDKAGKTGLILGKAIPPSTALQNDLAELAALEQTFNDELLVLLSSNLAESGGIGQVDQAARSAVITHFAERRSTSGRPTLALELGTRAWTGAVEGNPDSGSFLSQQLAEKRQRFGMTPRECIAALQRALSLSLPDVIVSTRDFNALMEQQYLFTTDFFQQQIGDSTAGNIAGSNGSHGRPDVSSTYMAPRNEVETLLADLWRSTFRIQEIGVDDNFFELGGHSLLAVQLLKNMNQTFSSRIALKDLFDGPTIAQLAAKISGTPANSDDAAELEALLAEIEGMSADELRAELDGNREGIKTE